MRMPAHLVHVTGVDVRASSNAVASSRSMLLQVVLAVIRLQGTNGDIIMMLSSPEACGGIQADQTQLFTAMCKRLRFKDRSLLS